MRKSKMPIVKRGDLVSFSSYLIAFTLPFSTSLNGVSIILFVLSGIISFQKKSLNTLLQNKINLLLIVFYCIGVVSLIYSSNLDSAVSLLVRRLTILLLPLILFFTTTKEIRIKYLLYSFLAANLIYTLVCFSYAFYDIIVTYREPRHFFTWWYSNQRLLMPFDGHHTYVSMYVIFSLEICVVFITRVKGLERGVLLISIPVLIYFLFRLESRIAIICFCIICIVSFLYIIASVSHKKIKRMGSIILLSIVTTAVWFTYHSDFYNDLLYKQDLKHSEDMNVASTFQSRFALWESGIYTIFKSPLIGHGIGDGNDELIKSYNQLGYDWAVKSEFNVHNQFLQFGLEVGLLGLSVFVVLFLISINLSIRRKYHIYTLFIVTVTIFCLSESILDRQKGIVFYSVFYSFLSMILFNSGNEYRKLQ